MEQLLSSCEISHTYPLNMLHDGPKHKIEAYATILKEQSHRLFCKENHIALDFLDSTDRDPAFHLNCATNLHELKTHLRDAFKHSDPKCRFIFIHAPHSRASLRISHMMLCFLFSYHQIMPIFLDYVFPFGEQEFQQDPHFGGFQAGGYLDLNRMGSEIPQLGRSRRRLWLCYNLRSVERSAREPDLKWSVEQTAVYHSLDMETGKILWITIKGNKLIRDRTIEALESAPPKSDSSSDALSDSLTTHLVFCEWSSENWRWYFNDLENELQRISRNALFMPVDMLGSPLAADDPSPPIASSIFTHTAIPSSGLTPLQSVRHTAVPSGGHTASPSSGRTAFLNIRAIFSGRTRTAVPIGTDSFTQATDQTIMQTSGMTGAASVDRMQPPVLPPSIQNRKKGGFRSQDAFKFTNLQRIQYLEEKTREALLALKLNTQVLEDLRQQYHTITEPLSFPRDISSHCRADILKFENRVLGMEKELSMQQCRAETLLSLLAERKNLLFVILQCRNMRASEVFTKKAQLSAINMEAMTNSMHEIARKTQEETVSMRIITLVTLFFLPGTFIATFMSTGIIKVNSASTGDFSPKGLRIYLAICLPLMLVTFLAWYLVYRTAKQRDRNRGKAVAASNDEM